MTYPIEIRKERKAYTTHRLNAVRRGIEFQISFEEWFIWWKTDNRWEKRGNRKGNLVMARENDEGPYRIGNVFCATLEDNLHPYRKGRTAENTPELQRHPDASTFPRRLKESLAVLRWSVRHVAPLINWDERTIRHWLSGRYEPPEDVLAWVEGLAVCHTQRPPPMRQRKNATPP
jgi:hypothetical protein